MTTIIGIILFVMQLLGIISSVNALMTTRTSQGTIAWIISLNTFPLAAVPAYWIFGRTKFHGYVTAKQRVAAETDARIQPFIDTVTPYIVRPTDEQHAALAGQRLAKMPYLRGNAVELLIDGDATFNSILTGIDAAEEYVLVQFYIVHDDDLGYKLKKHLIAKARQNIRIWFLYDEIGSHTLSASYLRDLRNAGIEVNSFHSTRGKQNRFQINFRNHRKIVVTDGTAAWVGGHNVGDEYLGKDPKFGHWRDTHMKITGPAALELQLSFAEDWHWATNEIISFTGKPITGNNGDATVLILPSGPADRLETASLMFQEAIHSAHKRIWITSPYFVPDESVISALHLAALRGVDVRVLIPDKADKLLIYYSAYAFAGELLQSGIKILRYTLGFLHEKVFLIDDVLAGVGTANFDSRSFRLNFEVTALVIDDVFVKEIEAMFLKDFSNSRPMTIEEVNGKSFLFKMLSRASYLSAPIQ